jgi:hypothetical protein
MLMLYNCLDRFDQGNMLTIDAMMAVVVLTSVFDAHQCSWLPMMNVASYTMIDGACAVKATMPDSDDMRVDTYESSLTIVFVASDSSLHYWPLSSNRK